ncbi:MAG TPA: hypothetical protein VF541_03015 [Longimicrobium sp.]
MTDRKEKERKAAAVYDRTKRFADRNAWVQAGSGLFGLGTNLIVDVAAIPYYADLWNDIRNLYGRGKISIDAAGAYIRPNVGFLLADLLYDKVLGSIPLLGIPFNYVCAKALTWRLGAWFGVLAALGEEGNPKETLVRSTMQLAMQFFPANKSLLSFEEPHKQRFVSFIAALDGLTYAETESRVNDALNVLEKGLQPA